MTPRDAFLGSHEVVAFCDAEGRVAAESLATYPPGIPNAVPGGRLTRETLDYIQDTLGHWGWVRGAVDRTLKTIRVVRGWARCRERFATRCPLLHMSAPRQAGGV